MDAVERIDILSKKFTSQVVAAILGIDQAQVTDVRLNPSAGESMVNPGGPIIINVGGPLSLQVPDGIGPKALKLTTIELPTPCLQVILSAAAPEYSIQSPGEYDPQPGDFSIAAVPAGVSPVSPAYWPNGQFVNGIPLAEPDNFPGLLRTEPAGQPVVTVAPPAAPHAATMTIDIYLVSYADDTGTYPMGLTLPKGIELHVA